MSRKNNSKYGNPTHPDNNQPPIRRRTKKRIPLVAVDTDIFTEPLLLPSLTGIPMKSAGALRKGDVDQIMSFVAEYSPKAHAEMFADLTQEEFSNVMELWTSATELPNMAGKSSPSSTSLTNTDPEYAPNSSTLESV